MASMFRKLSGAVMKGRINIDFIINTLQSRVFYSLIFLTLSLLNASFGGQKINHFVFIKNSNQKLQQKIQVKIVIQVEIVQLSVKCSKCWLIKAKYQTGNHTVSLWINHIHGTVFTMHDIACILFSPELTCFLNHVCEVFRPIKSSEV